MRLFWTAVVLIAALTAALGTWVITQPSTDTTVDSSTPAVTGALSPRAADYRDAQTLQQRPSTTTVPQSPNAADYRDAQTLQRASTTAPVSPNAADYRDKQNDTP